MTLKIQVMLLAAMACPAVLWPGSSDGATIAVHQRDSVVLPGDYPRLYDQTTGNLIASLSTSGTVGSPGSYYLQSLDYDATTGDLSGLVREFQGRARVLSWSPSGSLLSDVPLNGYPSDGYDNGMDMSVHGGVVAVHARDTLTLPADYPRLYDQTTGNLIASLSLSGTTGNPSGYYLQSLDFDATTGNLSGLVRATSLGSTARVLSWSPSGVLLSDIQLNGYPTDSIGYGMDMSVHGGVIAVHRRDSISLAGDAAQLFNATTGNPIASLSLLGIAGNSGNYYLQSLDFDATTGDLSGMARDVSVGTARVLSWSPSGALLSDVPLNGYTLDNTNFYGMDIAVFTVVPEPSTAVLTMAALIGLVAVVWRQRQKRDSST